MLQVLRNFIHFVNCYILVITNYLKQQTCVARNTKLSKITVNAMSAASTLYARLSVRRVLLMRHGSVLGAVRPLCERLILIWLCFGYKQSIKDDAFPGILCTALTA